ncbi:hypothetical protein [Enterovirga aerilata]|uniref:Helix-turn-helix domain-containing protein n=1 Tax=Enterovirga aerilata TaxID=2730920 RepID=A0A849I3R0_9HYPH|nr:hypothetical protein [Enterovirga sp. DB1703]NNM72274.1 hypothetical protein [Enterovirga sp. DB1703]
MPFAPKAPIDLALKERIRIAYYVEERSIAEVEAIAGVGRATLYRWFHAWGWPLRKPMRSRAAGQNGAPVFRPAGQEAGAGPIAAAPGEPPAGAGWQPATGRVSLKVRLRRLVEHRIAVLEHETMSGAAIDPEANARAIELNARTLATIEKLDGEADLCPNCRDEPPARSLNELRDELRRHLERIAGEEDEDDEAEGLPPLGWDDEEEGADAGPAAHSSGGAAAGS